MRKTLRSRRPGMTLVETVIVIMIVVMIIFGIFEYCRYLMVRNLMDNAARTGLRYAIVNNTSTTVAADTSTVVTGGTLTSGTVVPDRMAGQETTAFKSGTFTVTVSGVHNGTTYTGNNVNALVAGDMMTVTVTGTFNFMNIMPIINLGTMTMTSSPTMVCEGAN
jgi:Flp pilus assembly protein TadG